MKSQPKKIPTGTICCWLNNGREFDIYIDGYNTACRDYEKWLCVKEKHAKEEERKKAKVET